MKVAVAIFAKTIGLSQVKTRLAAEIGKARAEEFYSLSVSAVEEVLGTASSENIGLCPHWALAEETAVSLPQWQRFPALWTGDGGLGERLASVSEALFSSHDGVIFIGTDSPQIDAKLFVDVLQVMKTNSEICVVGPAEDGGFYLLGSMLPVHRNIWEEVSYSQDDTLFQLQGLLEDAGRKVRRLAVEQDVDRLDDLKSLQARLIEDEDSLLPAQKNLADWLLSMERGNEVNQSD